MPIYTFKAITATGAWEKGTLEADSTQSLLQMLHAKGLVPVETAETRKPVSSSGFWSLSLSRGLTLENWAEFTNELSVFLGAGLPIDQCLRILSEESRVNSIRKLSASLLEETLSGSTLSAALVKHAKDAPTIIEKIIKSSEGSGNLGEAMEDLSKYLAAQTGMQQELKSALTYPVVLVLTAIATFLVIVTTLVPALIPMFEQAGTQPPLILRSINNFANFVTGNAMMIGAGFALIALSALLWLRTESGKLQRDAIIRKLPVIGPISLDTNTALFSKTLGTLLHNGVPLTEALQTAVMVLTNLSMREKVRPAVTQIMEGSGLTRALKDTGQFSDLTLRFVSIGEEASRQDVMLLNLSQILQRNVERKLKTGIALLGPALTLIIGVAIGGLILTVMQAVLSVNDLVLQ